MITGDFLKNEIVGSSPTMTWGLYDNDMRLYADE